jgi:hypothetical protein
MRERMGVILDLVVLARPAISRAQADALDRAGLPGVVLIGDSIRTGYAPKVVARLAGRVAVISPPANGGDSANVVEHLDEWVIRQKPDLVHLNCGLHELNRSKADGRHQVELARYEANLRRIIARIRDETGA